MDKKLTRSREGRTISGICMGISKYLDIDVTVIRLIWVIISIVTGGAPGVIAYIAALFIIPDE